MQQKNIRLELYKVVTIRIAFFCLVAVQTTLKFTYREKYPDETPLYEIVSQENLEDNDVTDIIKLLEQQVRKMEYLDWSWYHFLDITSHFSQNLSLKSVVLWADGLLMKYIPYCKEWLWTWNLVNDITEEKYRANSVCTDEVEVCNEIAL